MYVISTNLHSLTDPLYVWFKTPPDTTATTTTETTVTKVRDKGSVSVSSSAMDRVQAAISARETTQVQPNGRAERVAQLNDSVGQSNDRVERVAQSNIPSEEDVLGMWSTQPVEDNDEDAKAFAQVTFLLLS